MPIVDSESVVSKERKKNIAAIARRKKKSDLVQNPAKWMYELIWYARLLAFLPFIQKLLLCFSSTATDVWLCAELCVTGWRKKKNRTKPIYTNRKSFIPYTHTIYTSIVHTLIQYRRCVTVCMIFFSFFFINSVCSFLFLFIWFNIRYVFGLSDLNVVVFCRLLCVSLVYSRHKQYHNIYSVLHDCSLFLLKYK